MLKTETVADERDLDPRRVGDEKESGGDVVFLAEFTGKYLGDRARPPRIEAAVERAVRRGIDGVYESGTLGSPSGRHCRSDDGGQPESFVIDLNHCFVQRDVSRRFTATGCKPAFWTKSWTSSRHRCTDSVDTI